MMTLNEKLTHLRKKEGLSQIEVSEKLAVSRQAVSRWESGESRPSTDNLQALCKLYHVQLDYLLNESNDEPQATTPASTAAESEQETAAQKKEKQWVRKLVIGAVTVVLLACCMLLYVNEQKSVDSNLHDLSKENLTLPEMPEFNMTFE